MSKLTQDRITFIELLHDVFINRTGHGAFATISVTEAMELFDKCLASGQSTNNFVNQYVRSV